MLNKKTLIYLFFLFNALLIFAPSTYPFSSGTTNPRDQIVGQIDALTAFVFGLMLIMIILAALIYALGPLFGAEFSARGRVYANGMLGAVAVGALIFMLGQFLFSTYRTGGAPAFDPNFLLRELLNVARTTLAILIILLVVVAALIYSLGQSFDAENRARAVQWANYAVASALVCSVLYVLAFEILGQLTNATLLDILGLRSFGPVLINITFVVATFILIVYLGAKFFRISEWEAYLNIEFSNLMGSFVLLIFILGFFVAGNLIARAYVPGSATPTQAVILSLRTVVADNVLRGLYDVYYIQSCTSVLNTYSKRLGEAANTYNYKVFPGIDTFVSVSNVLSYGLVVIYGSINAQISMLYLLDAFSSSFLLPAGFILRLIPPTRDAGAFIIALAFSFMVIFPITYQINIEALRSVFQITPTNNEFYHSNQFLINNLCGGPKYGFWGYALNPSSSPLAALPIVGRPLASRVLPTLSRLMSDGYLNLVSMSEFLPIMRDLSALSLVGLFMPALSILFTIASINVITKFIMMKG